MKRHEVKDFLPILEAWKNGGHLQYNSLPHRNDCWSDVYEVALNEPPNCYRIKPTPKFRPWKPEEVPFNCWIKTRHDDSKFYWKPVTINDEGVVTISGLPVEGTLSAKLNSYKHLFDSCDYSSDLGKTWHPCGVLEDQP